MHSTFILLQEIFYSRKNFQRPDLQKPPHKNFSEEVKILEKYFGAGAGMVFKFYFDLQCLHYILSCVQRTAWGA